MYKLVLFEEHAGATMELKSRDVPNYKLADVIAAMDDLYKIIPHDAFAQKIWVPEDIQNVLIDRYDYQKETIEENGLVDRVLCQHALDALGDCTDMDWEIVHQAIRDAGIGVYND